MAHRFIIDSSPMGKEAPSTPDRRRANNLAFSQFEDSPSSTPWRLPLSFESRTTSSTGGGGLFGRTRNPNAPLGRPIGGGRAPSGLSRQLRTDDNDDKEIDFDEDIDDDNELPL
ncbi:hypothetical protein TrVFT333_000633 [Trichoderma virens FT-333]|nr:hypothetical protein TrVFT333_000633 [Trichoderma virens FT-333]